MEVDFPRLFFVVGNSFIAYGKQLGQIESTVMYWRHFDQDQLWVNPILPSSVDCYWLCSISD